MMTQYKSLINVIMIRSIRLENGGMITMIQKIYNMQLIHFLSFVLIAFIELHNLFPVNLNTGKATGISFGSTRRNKSIGHFMEASTRSYI